MPGRAGCLSHQRLLAQRCNVHSKPYWNSPSLPLVFLIHLPSHSWPLQRAWTPFPLSCHFSTNLLFFLKMLYKPQVATTPSSYTSSTCPVCMCTAKVYKLCFSLVSLTFVHFIFRAPVAEPKREKKEGFFPSPTLCVCARVCECVCGNCAHTERHWSHLLIQEGFMEEVKKKVTDRWLIRWLIRIQGTKKSEGISGKRKMNIQSCVWDLVFFNSGFSSEPQKNYLSGYFLNSSQDVSY